MTLIRIIPSPDGLGQKYLDLRTDNHGFIYKVDEEKSGDVVVVASSVATGAVVSVLREHTETLEE